MTEKKFDAAFLNRLAVAVRAIEDESDDANDAAPLGPEDYDVIYAAYEESGGDSVIAKKLISAALDQCSQALGRILQYIADQYGIGPVEGLDHPRLLEIARDARDATENWLDEVAMLGRATTPRNPLQGFLQAHYLLNEAMLELHDQILWPIARRISPND